MCARNVSFIIMLWGKPLPIDCVIRPTSASMTSKVNVMHPYGNASVKQMAIAAISCSSCLSCFVYRIGTIEVLFVPRGF